MRTDRDYADSMELVETVMEWIGMRWTVSMIKRELRSYFGNDLSFQTCNYLIKSAKAEIRKRFNIDPQEYKGIQITFYESIIRRSKEKTINQLKAAERLDSLFGLEQVTGDDPEVQARKIREALKEMDECFEDTENGDEQRSENDGEGENKTEDGDSKRNESGCNDSGSQSSEKISGETSQPTEPVAESEVSVEEAVNEIDKLKKEDFERFRNRKE